MKFPNIDAAQEWSTQHEHHMFCEVEGARGVLEVYPGGRKIFRGADFNKATGEYSKVYRRYLKKLTPDVEFYKLIDLTKQRDILAASLQAVDCAEWLDLLLKHPTLMNNPTGVSIALYGCVPVEDICSAHDEPLECIHCCANGDKHDCQPALEALKARRR